MQTPTYVILLTSRDSSADIVQGLRAGADDYVTKPANEDELVARVNVGARVVQLQTALADRVRSLEEALANVKALQTLLPMCAYCKSIRNDQNYWEKVETYFTQHSNVVVHAQLLPELLRAVRPARARGARGRARRAGSPAARLMAEPVVLDPAVIEATAPADAARASRTCWRKCCKLFLEEVPPRIARLRNAWAAGNIEEVHRAAHSLKGSAGNIGAQPAVSRCAASSTSMGKSGDLTGAAPLVDALGVEFGKVEVRNSPGLQ